MTDADPGLPSRRYLLGLLDAVRAEVEVLAAAVGGAARDASAPLPHVIGDRAEAQADADERRGGRVALRDLARTFALTPVQVTALVAAAAPDLDQTVADLYAYLDEDAATARVTTGLLLQLVGARAWHDAARDDLAATSVLLEEGLLERQDSTSALRARWSVPTDVLDVLLGRPLRHAALRDLLVDLPPVPGEVAEHIARVLDAGGRLVHVREGSGGLAPARAVAGLTTAAGPPLVVDLGLVLVEQDLTALVRTALRDAQLTGRGLVLGPLDPVRSRAVPALRLLARSGWPVVVHGVDPWDPSWTVQVPVEIDVSDSPPGEREAYWRAALAHRLDDAEATTLAVGVRHLRLGAVQVVRAVDAAVGIAAVQRRSVAEEDLGQGARRQNGTGLERLARRVRPAATPEDLVLPPAPAALLADLVDRHRHREALHQHQVGGPSASRRGLTALFGGPPGTGKTLAAEVLAGQLGADLYAVDLSTVVDKYVGETEKNLERIFTQASGVHGVLLFDEADALFGRRGQVTEAKDRHANMGVAYLLQRLEEFDGVAVLATNLRSNLDEAFVRRLDVVIDFPLPDAAAREQLWRRCLGPTLPHEDQLDLHGCAADFALSGGEIRNVVVSAAYRALAASRPVATADLVDAVHREFRKMGRLVDPRAR